MDSHGDNTLIINPKFKMKLKLLFFAILISTLVVNVFYSCDVDDSLQITTKKVSNITQANAKSGGIFKSQSEKYNYTYGVVWDINPQPTLETNCGITYDIIDKYGFTSSLQNLDPNTKYYVRAYAKNETITLYGKQIEFTTTNIAFGKGVTDIDNNEYSSVIIGEQEWMAENLKTTAFNDGTEIELVTENEQWEAISSSAFCWYNNDNPNLSEAYGALYNFYTIETGKLCPTGWHVPTKEEWSVLLNYVGVYAGGKLKSTRVTPADHPRWESPNKYATDVFNFSALPSGCRWDNGVFYNLGYSVYFWSSTLDGERYGYAYSFANETDGYVISNFLKNNGFAVRCIKNTN